MAGNESRLVGVPRGASTIIEISTAFENEGFRGQFGSGERGEAGLAINPIMRPAPCNFGDQLTDTRLR
jgi:hypothetical protein